MIKHDINVLSQATQFLNPELLIAPDVPLFALAKISQWKWQEAMMKTSLLSCWGGGATLTHRNGRNGCVESLWRLLVRCLFALDNHSYGRWILSHICDMEIFQHQYLGKWQLGCPENINSSLSYASRPSARTKQSTREGFWWDSKKLV